MDFDVADYVMKNSLCVVSVDELTLQFKDTEKFPILDDLKHLGVTHIVYPGVVHARVQHALDIYHLSKETVNQFKRYQGPELGIDDFQVQTVNLAGLLDHVGHGSFKAESGFLSKSLQGSSERSHEDMSVRLLDYIVDKCHIEIDALMQKQLKEVAVASIVRASRDVSNRLLSDDFLRLSVAKKPELVPLVSKALLPKASNHLRSSSSVSDPAEFWKLNDTILQRIGTDTHPELKEAGDLILQIIIRRVLYQNYDSTVSEPVIEDDCISHLVPGCRQDRIVRQYAKKLELDVDALLKALTLLRSSSLNDPAQFWKRIETDNHPEVKEARDLILQIKRRVLYQFCNEFTVPKERLEPLKNLTPQQIICSQGFRQVFVEQGGRTKLLNIHKAMDASSLYGRLGLDPSTYSLTVGWKTLKVGDSLDILENLSLIRVFARLRGGCSDECQHGFKTLHTVLHRILGFREQLNDIDHYWQRRLDDDEDVYGPRKAANRDFLKKQLYGVETELAEMISSPSINTLLANGSFSRCQPTVITEQEVESVIELACRGIWNGFRVKWSGLSPPSPFILEKAEKHGINLINIHTDIVIC